MHQCQFWSLNAIVGPNRVRLHFEPENVNFLDFKCQFRAFGSGFEHFEVQKMLQRDHISLKKINK
jgi:hypothetical protein